MPAAIASVWAATPRPPENRPTRAMPGIIATSISPKWRANAMVFARVANRPVVVWRTVVVMRGMIYPLGVFGKDAHPSLPANSRASLHASREQWERVAVDLDNEPFAWPERVHFVAEDLCVEPGLAGMPPIRVTSRADRWLRRWIALPARLTHPRPRRRFQTPGEVLHGACTTSPTFPREPRQRGFARPPTTADHAGEPGDRQTRKRANQRRRTHIFARHEGISGRGPRLELLARRGALEREDAR